mgnify:CR=1 FL=1
MSCPVGICVVPVSIVLWFMGANPSLMLTG